MKICILETSPNGPIDSGSINKRKEFIESDKCDFFFVTHDTQHKDALEFRKGHRWASNRNYLAKHAVQLSKPYDYFWFTDYDVEYTSNTSLPVIDQILEDLKKTMPAVMTCFDPKKQSMASHRNIYLKPDHQVPYRSALMTNNQMKIVHKSLIDYFFPLPLKYHGVWDACLFFNLLEIPFLASTVMTYNVFGSGLISGAESQGTQDSMIKLMSEMKNILNFDIGNSPSNVSTAYQVKSRMSRIKANSLDVSFYNKDLLSKYINLDKLNKFKVS